MVLGVIEVSPHGVLNGVNDGGVAFASKDTTGDFVFGCRKTLLALEFIESKGPVRFFRLTLFPDLDSLCGDDLFIRRGSDRSVGGCRGRGSRETTDRVGILRLAKRYPEGEKGEEEVIHLLIVGGRSVKSSRDFCRIGGKPSE